MENIKELISKEYKNADNKINFVEDLRKYIHEELSTIQQPIDYVRWVSIGEVEPNDYNPNSVAKVEMGLLYKSIKHDGYTQPIVTIYDEEKKKYVIVDGFHRYFTAFQNQETVRLTAICDQLEHRLEISLDERNGKNMHPEIELKDQENEPFYAWNKLEEALKM